MKRLWPLLGLALILTLLGGRGARAQDLPAPVREAALADLHARVAGLGRPLGWTYSLIVADNSNLACPSAPLGQTLTPLIEVYIITFDYPNAVTYTYHVSEDAAFVVPCDPKLPLTTLATPAPLLLATPQNFPDFAYVSSTCPSDFRGYTPPRLRLGAFGIAQTGDPVFLRETPSAQGRRLDTLPARSAFFILGGPECTPDGNVWWRGEWAGQVGWVQESRLGGYYFLAPASPQEVGIVLRPTPSATPAPSLTPSPSPTFTATPSPTPSPTLTASPSLTPSPTLTATPSLTPSLTLTASATPPPLLPPVEALAVLSAGNISAATPLAQLLGVKGVLAWDGTGRLLVGGAESVHIYDLRFASSPTRLSLPGGELLAVAGGAEGLFFALGTGALYRFDGETLSPFANFSLPVRALALDGRGGLGALLAQGFNLWTADPAAWNTPNGLRLTVAEGAGRALAFHPTQAEVALQLGANLYLLETETGRVRGAFPLDPAPTCAGLAYTPEGTLFFADCTGLYRLDTTEGPRFLSAFAGRAIRGLLAGASASFLGVLTDEGLALVASADGESLQNLAGVSAACFSPDGRLLAVQTAEGVAVWGVQAE